MRVDRKKHVVKTGGVIVSSREVEEALFSHPAVQEVAVIPLPHPKWIESVTAIVVLKARCHRRAGCADRAANRTLAPFNVPEEVHFIDALLKNTAGKLLKRELEAKFRAAKT